MNCLNFKTHRKAAKCPAKPMRFIREPLCERSARKTRDLVWDSVRYGKVKKFYFYGKKLRRPYGPYRSVVGKKNAYTKFGLKILNSDPHRWHGVSSLQFSVSGSGHWTPDTGHWTQDTGPLERRIVQGSIEATASIGHWTHHSHHHHHGHRKHHHHDPHHNSHFSWFFFWQRGGINPYSVCTKFYKAGSIKLAEAKPNVARFSGNTGHFSLKVRPQPHCSKKAVLHTKDGINLKNRNRTTGTSPVEAGASVIKGKKRNSNGHCTPETGNRESSRVTNSWFQILSGTGRKDKSLHPKTSVPTVAPIALSKPKTTAATAEKPGIRKAAAASQINSAEKMSSAAMLQAKSNTPDTGHRQPDTNAAVSKARPKTQDSPMTVSRQPENPFYILSSIPVKIIYPKVAVGASALPE